MEYELNNLLRVRKHKKKKKDRARETETQAHRETHTETERDRERQREQWIHYQNGRDEAYLPQPQALQVWPLALLALAPPPLWLHFPPLSSVSVQPETHTALEKEEKKKKKVKKKKR